MLKQGERRGGRKRNRVELGNRKGMRIRKCTERGGVGGEEEGKMVGEGRENGKTR